jgi:tetratricopeptide (TPR) repeat protein
MFFSRHRLPYGGSAIPGTTLGVTRARWAVGLVVCLPCLAGSVTAIPAVEAGYRQMYNLDFDEAHKTFGAWERDHPKDPMGSVSNAAAYLFAEFDRLNILHSEFFVEDSMFRHRPKVTADPAVRKAFDDKISKTLQLSDATLAQSPRDTDAMFVKIMALGLRADFDALIDRHYLDSLKVLKTSRATAEELLAIEPAYYDAYLAVGVENYMLSLKPAPLRWFLQLNGAETDRDRGIQNLRLTAEKGHYLSAYARLLLAVAALRNKDLRQAREILSKLVTEFPRNRLYSQELARLQ